MSSANEGDNADEEERQSCCSCCKGKEKSGMSDINRNRHCTDLLCCIIFILFLCTAAGVSMISALYGNAYSIVYANDYTGNTCGSPNINRAESERIDRTAKKYIVYPRLAEDMLSAAATASTDPLSIDFFGICVKECPSAGTWVCTDEGWQTLGDRSTSVLDDCRDTAGGGTFMALAASIAGGECETLLGNCYYQVFDTKDVLYRCLNRYPNNVLAENTICVDPLGADPDSDKCVKKQTNKTISSDESAQEDLVAAQMGTVAALVTSMIADVRNSLGFIFIVGVGGTFVLGILWLTFLRYCAKLVVWLNVLGLLFVLVCASFFALAKAGFISVSDVSAVTNVTTSATGIVIPEEVTSTPTFEKEQELWRIAAIVQCAITIIYLLIITFFWRKINIAATIISEASKAVKAMPSVLIFPVAPVLLTSVVAAWWLYVAGGLYTAGTITTGDIASTGSNITGLDTGNFTSTLSVQEDMNVKDYLMAYHIFSWLWLNNFVHGIAMTTICGAFAGWYWTVIEDGKKTQKDRIPVIAALWRVVRYHLGSIAYGSGIIAVIQFIRLVLAYIDKRTKNAQKSNVVLKVAIKIVQCCMYCFEKFIKFVSRNAYIIIAIKGSSFCSSTMTVFGLLLRHGAQINLTSLISSLILMLGKLILVAGAGAAGFVVLEYTTLVEDVSSKILPIAFIIFISFLVATAFLDVYDLGIASILICFCIDLEENQAGSYMFSESLARAAGKKGQTRASSSSGQSTEKYVADDDDDDDAEEGGPIKGDGDGDADDFI